MANGVGDSGRHEREHVTKQHRADHHHDDHRHPVAVVTRAEVPESRRRHCRQSHVPRQHPVVEVVVRHVTVKREVFPGPVRQPIFTAFAAEGNIRVYNNLDAQQY